MKHLQSFQLFEGSSTDTKELIATNQSSYSFSHDDMASDTYLKRIAKIILDGDNLWLEIRETGSITGPYERPENAKINKELVYQNIGKISKPDLNKVRTLLKEHSFDRTNRRFASGFKAQWKDLDDNDGTLSDIINKFKEKKGMKTSPTISASINREDIIQEIGYEIQQMPDEQLQQLKKLIQSSKNWKYKFEEGWKPKSEGVGGFKIVNYSDKSVAVFGDTKPIKDQLKHMGGRFNPFLVNPDTGQKEAGWVFPVSKLAELKSLQ